MEPEEVDRIVQEMRIRLTPAPTQQTFVDTNKKQVTDALVIDWAKKRGLNGRQVRRLVRLSKAQPAVNLDDLVRQL